MATVYSLVCESGSSGTYWAGLSTAEKLRYGAAGSERVYGGLYSALEAMKTANRTDDWVVEIAEAFTDTDSQSTQFEINNSYLPGSITIQPMVNGVVTSAFHNGDATTASGGYIWYRTSYNAGFRIARSNITIWGIKVISAHAYNVQSPLFLSSACASVTAYGCIFIHTGSAGGPLCSMSGAANRVLHCLFIAEQATSANGLCCVRYSGAASIVANCLFIGPSGNTGKGAYTNGSDANYISVASTIIMGFGTNWDTKSTNSIMLANNVGETGDTVWDTEGGSAITGVNSTWFVNFANRNFRPATDSVALVGGGTAPYNVPAVDLANNVRPNYNPSGEENWDIGPFEYDHGNGLAPLQVSLTISGMVEGSVLSVYKDADGSAIISPTTITSSGSHSISYTYSADTQITVKVRKASGGTKYLPYSAPGLITDSGFSLIVNQIEDPVLN